MEPTEQNEVDEVIPTQLDRIEEKLDRLLLVVSEATQVIAGVGEQVGPLVNKLATNPLLGGLFR